MAIWNKGLFWQGALHARKPHSCRLALPLAAATISASPSVFNASGLANTRSSTLVAGAVNAVVVSGQSSMSSCVSPSRLPMLRTLHSSRTALGSLVRWLPPPRPSPRTSTRRTTHRAQPYHKRLVCMQVSSTTGITLSASGQLWRTLRRLPHLASPRRTLTSPRLVAPSCVFVNPVSSPL